MSMTKTTFCDERDWMQLDPLLNNAPGLEFMARVTLAIKYHIPYLERSFESNMCPSQSGWSRKLRSYTDMQLE